MDPDPAGTAPGQDLNLSTDRIKATHGFVNKVWNAGKFVLMACEAADEAAKADLARADFSSPEAAAQLPLAERWILGALHQVRDTVAVGCMLCPQLVSFESYCGWARQS